jgi:mannan endo-1,4-beta-mannosidase
MKKRDMHAVIYLNNYWEWSGGMAVYNKWFNNGKVMDPYNLEHGWVAFMDYTASFYKNEKANEYFRKYIKKIVTRRNPYTEQFYFEDTTIMAWELANEPRAGSLNNGFANLDNYYKWIDETAKYIHSIDPNHLVTTGSEGVIGSLLREDIFLKAHESKYIDYVTFHLWAKNWNWFNAKKIDETYVTAEKNAIDYFNRHMILSRKLNKPITLEEFGLPRDNENYNPGTPTSARDKYYEKLLSVVYDSSAAEAPIAGTNFWAWAGEGRGKNDDNFWRVGDPFTGDPPHEPQGINSVYDTDFTTINILKDHAAKMIILNEKSFLNK